MSTADLAWLCKGQKDPLTGIHSHEAILRAREWWQRKGRALVGDAMFKGKPGNRGSNPAIGILGAYSWDTLTAEERYRVTVAFYEHHVLKPWLDELETAIDAQRPVLH